MHWKMYKLHYSIVPVKLYILPPQILMVCMVFVIYPSQKVIMYSLVLPVVISLVLLGIIMEEKWQ